MDLQLFYVGVSYLRVNYTKDNSKAIPVHDYCRPLGFQKPILPDLKKERNVLRLSAPLTGRLYTPENIPGNHFWQGLSSSQGHSAARSIMSMKSSMTPPRIEPAIFWLVALCLNQLRHRVSPFFKGEPIPKVLQYWANPWEIWSKPLAIHHFPKISLIFWSCHAGRIR